MKKYTTTIILVLILIAVAGGLWFLDSSYSTFSVSNICQDYDYATEMYQTEKNPKKLLKFAQKRSNNCKTLLYAKKNDTNVYKKMDNCDLLDSAGVASGFVINFSVQHLRDFETANNEYIDIKESIKPFDYCPQFIEINNALDSFARTNKLKVKNDLTTLP